MFFRNKKTYPKEYKIMQQPTEKPNKFQKAQINRKFGMFIHFGINTFNNVDWSDGKLPIESYCPSAVDADHWVKTAYEAGMNFVVFTAKHHDGFCLWNTSSTDYSINYSPVKTDAVKAVSNACKKYGIKLGLYYSLWDRHENCYKDNEAYVQYMEKQLTELLDGKYGEVVELWLDGGWDKACCDWQLDRLYNLVKTLQPSCQFGVNVTIGKFNNKKGNPKKRYLPKNQRNYDPIRMFPSDFRLWDPHMCANTDPKLFTFNKKVYYLPFEQTVCSREGGPWFYNDNYETRPFYDIDTVVNNYKILEKNQNIMVLNLPPDRNGKLVQSDIDNLMLISEKLGLKRN